MADLTMDLERWMRELRKGSTRLALLAVLSEKETYGYEILTELRKKGAVAWGSTEATVYPLLHDLESAGFLSSRWVATDTGVPPRKYYKLTATGVQLLEALRGAWKQYKTEMDTLVGGP